MKLNIYAAYVGTVYTWSCHMNHSQIVQYSSDPFFYFYIVKNIWSVTTNSLISFNFAFRLLAWTSSMMSLLPNGRKGFPTLTLRSMTTRSKCWQAFLYVEAPFISPPAPRWCNKPFKPNSISCTKSRAHIFKVVKQTPLVVTSLRLNQLSFTSWLWSNRSPRHLECTRTQTFVVIVLKHAEPDNETVKRLLIYFIQLGRDELREILAK